MISAGKKIRLLFVSPWFLTFVFNVVFSHSLCLLRKPISEFDLKTYLYSLLISFVFWAFIGFVHSSRVKKRTVFVFSLLVAFFISFLLAATYLVYEEFALFISRDMAIDIRDDPLHMANYFSTYLNPWGFAFLGSLTFWTALWYFLKRDLSPGFIGKGKKALVFLLAPSFLLVGLNHIRSADARRRMTMDTAFLLAAKRSVETVKSSRLYTSFDRLKVKGKIPRDPVNIVILLNESWSKHGLKEYGFQGEAAPFLSRWTEKDKDLFFIFDYFFSNSGNTDVSVPSLFAGVGSYERNDKLHQAPLLWDWAKGAGYHTVFVTSQRMTWQSLREFLVINGPARHYTAPEMDAPVVNDIGVDDLTAAEYFKTLLEQSPRGKPFLAVFGSNALHSPYQRTSDRLEVQPDFSVGYENALYILDKAFEKIYRTLENLGKLDDTLFILTSDHCVFPLKKNIPRTFSFYDEALNIPFLIRVPPKWLKLRPRHIEALKTNRSRLAANVDIAPTVAAILELDQVEENQEILKRLRGYSLLRPIPEDRTVIAINSNDVKAFVSEGFGIYRGSERFVFSTAEGPGYFDIHSDPRQNNNIWDKIGKTDKERLLNIIESRYHLKRVFKNYKISSSSSGL